MPAPPRNSTQEIVNALLRWRTVAGAARELGMRRNSLYERAQRLGIDLDAIRSGGPSVAPMPDMSGMSGMPGRSPLMPGMPGAHPERGLARKSQRARFPSGDAGRRLMGMQTAAATADEIPQRKTKVTRANFLPAQAALLSDAKYEFQYVLRADIDETKILELFIAEEFERWKAKTLARLESERASGSEPQAKRAMAGAEKPRKGTNGDDRKAAK